MDQATHQLLHAVGFNMYEEIKNGDFRGCPLVSSGLEFKNPLFLGEVVTVTSYVEKIGKSSFTVKHSFTNAEKTVVAEGQEIRVWAVTDPEDSARMTSTPVPDRVRRALERPGIVDTTLAPRVPDTSAISRVSEATPERARSINQSKSLSKRLTSSA